MITKRLTTSAICLALSMLLPFATGQIPQIGNMLLPMHFPVFVCAFLCGGWWGMGVGLLAPLLRSALFGMPVMWPVAMAMGAEMATYGAVAGFLFRLYAPRLTTVYATLIAAMVAGRLVWGLVMWAAMGAMAQAFTIRMFFMSAIVFAAPGILLQFILIPPLVLALTMRQGRAA